MSNERIRKTMMVDEGKALLIKPFDEIVAKYGE